MNGQLTALMMGIWASLLSGILHLSESFYWTLGLIMLLNPVSVSFEESNHSFQSLYCCLAFHRALKMPPSTCHLILRGLRVTLSASPRWFSQTGNCEESIKDTKAYHRSSYVLSRIGRTKVSQIQELAFPRMVLFSWQMVGLCHMIYRKLEMGVFETDKWLKLQLYSELPGKWKNCMINFWHFSHAFALFVSFYLFNFIYLILFI